jgi:hypothetical protein
LTGQLYFDPNSNQYSVFTGDVNNNTTNIICDTSLTFLKPFLDSVKKNKADVIISGYQLNYCESDPTSPIGISVNIDITKITY